VRDPGSGAFSKQSFGSECTGRCVCLLCGGGEVDATRIALPREGFHYLGESGGGSKRGRSRLARIEAMVPVRPGDDDTDRMQFTRLVLDIVKSEAGHVRHLSHISRLLWFDQKQLQKSGISHPETEYPEPSSQNSLPFLKLDGFKPSSLISIRAVSECKPIPKAKCEE